MCRGYKETIFKSLYFEMFKIFRGLFYEMDEKLQTVV